ncbi:AMP-binding protein [Vibrio sp. SCSIO 43137]|uniref:AMP-binding protein n=1 Tax=Vibrio sp. SCSIO 43137 TaxID=3021011 RepID=UPI00230772E3|nr:AMP-binding protein [Vibrio sp. SCSIO 43137]WCE29852.1 AMP-binding protein [Vibrio sp. SCSIO 43137]
MSIFTKLVFHSKIQGQKTAVIDNGDEYSYSRLVEDIGKTALKLKELNVQPRDRVLVTSSNDYAFVVTYFAVSSVEAIFVNLAQDVSAEHKQYVRDKSQPIIQIDSCKEFLEEVSTTVSIDEQIELEVDDSDVAELVFTSGTTGEPKGVSLTNGQIEKATRHIVEQVKNTSEDVELLLMPLSHSFGMGRLRSVLYVGSTLVIGYPLQRLKRVFQAIERYHVTGLGLVPSAWSFITSVSKNLITKFADQIRYIEFGSAYLSIENKRLLTDWFPKTHIVMHYGLTEVSRALFIHFHTDNLESIGRLSRGADVKVLSENGRFAKEGEVGEIVLKSTWMMSAYYQNNSLTNSSFVDGYFRTGDLGRLKGEYLFLEGRLKEIINVGGKKVSPYQVEETLLKSPYVKECACVALPDLLMGEVVQAFIVLDSTAESSIEQAIESLKELVAELLPVHMRPQKYQPVANLPKTSSGKIQRLKLLTKEVY